MSVKRQARLIAIVNDRVALPPRTAPFKVITGGAATNRRSDAGEEDDPRLRELAARAHALIDALRRCIPATAMSATLDAYVRAAREIGVKGERLHDALELLVHEHARVTRGSAATILLRDLLRLADPGFRVGNCPHGSPTAAVPHWCRLHRRARGAIGA